MDVMHNFPGVILDAETGNFISAVLLEVPGGINAGRAFLNEDKEGPVSIVLVYVQTSFNTVSDG